MIPKHCIQKFIDRFKSYPSIIQINREYIQEDLEKILSKTHMLWSKEIVDSMGKRYYYKRLYEYDSSGIFIYVKTNTLVFILTTVDRKNVADFMINGLKNKKNGNNK